MRALEGGGLSRGSCPLRERHFPTARGTLGRPGVGRSVPSSPVLTGGLGPPRSQAAFPCPSSSRAKPPPTPSPHVACQALRKGSRAALCLPPPFSQWQAGASRHASQPSRQPVEAMGLTSGQRGVRGCDRSRFWGAPQGSCLPSTAPFSQRL